MLFRSIQWSKRGDLDTDAMVQYYKALIGIKKTFPHFQIATKSDINSCLTIADTKRNDGIARYAVKDPASNSYAVVLYNATAEESEILIPNGTFKVYVNGASATSDKNSPLDTVTGDRMKVGAYSAVVMVGDLDAAAVTAWVAAEKAAADPAPAPADDGDGSGLGLKLGLGIGIPVAVLAAGGAAAAVLLTKKKKGGKGDPEPAGDDEKTEDKPEEEVKREEEDKKEE